MKNYQMSNLTNIRRVGAKFIHADGETDEQTYMRKLVVTFLELVKASSN
jgi:hypothetical protein